MKNVGVILVAAGSGTRLHADVPKAWVRVNDRPLVDHALERVLAVPAVQHVVVVVPKDRTDTSGKAWKAVPAVGDDRVVVTAGGATRSDSVSAGLGVLDERCEVVLVHDAARCFTPTSIFQTIVETVSVDVPVVVPGIPVVDTIKIVDGDGTVIFTPDRGTLRAAQTPQGFTREALETAHRTGMQASDDAALFETLGIAVRVIEGHPDAFKITTPNDLQFAQIQFGSRPTAC